MRSRAAVHLTNLAVNASIVSGAVLVTLLVLEFVVFRFVLKAPDLPRVAFENGVVKYAPNQHGINRVRYEIKVAWHVNANGWTSSIAEYKGEKPAATYRIAVIGDSYIEGLGVEPEENVAERLQESLGNPAVEVYRFGISGAPMSHYLHMLRREVCRYSPDLVIVNLVHNDFSESYRFKQGVYASSFLKLKIENGRVVQEIEPREHVKPWYSAIRHGSATWRYLAYRQQVRFQFLRDLLLDKAAGSPAGAAGAPVAGPPPTPKTEPDRDDDLVATQYVVTQLRLKAAECGADLVLVMDGDRSSIYAGRTEPSSNLNAIVNSVTEQQGIPLVDLHEVFLSDYLKHHERFNFEADYHWNKRGHAIAAHAIAKLLTERAIAPTPR
jgi:lysophospholipase L1-like esterase